MDIGILTSGGDAPGMNAAIRAVVRYAKKRESTVHGIHYGYLGLCGEPIKYVKIITPADVAQCINRGGTILRSARYHDFEKKEEVRVKALENLKDQDISSLVVIGGDGSFKGVQALFQTNKDNNIIDNFFITCIPASIDNDIPCTKFSIGVDTALNTAVECIDKLRDTAYSHRRVFVIQIMGRNCDYLPYMTGISAGASKVFPPDYQFNDITTEDGKSKIIDITELVDKIARGFNIGKDFFMVIVSEGLSESLKKINEVYGAYTPADIIAKEIDRELQKKVDNVSVRPVVLGYVQRGGKPSHFDRLLATRLGVQAVIEIIENKDKYSGPIMVGIQNDCDDDKLKEKIISVPLSEVLSSPMHKCDKECKELLKYVTR